ncbi:MAG TPA: PilZ domain-containing protein [Acidimicrobiia bacterium]|nr:PilZ domain-containing protein [Acidimicrobiia bacterium]
MATDTTRALSVSGSRPIRVGAWARVELAGGDVWAGRVSYVSGELVGLKASTIVVGRVKAGDTVTLVIGKGESMVAAQARVLSASGSFMRVSRRESSEGLERRRALRVPIEQIVTVSYTTPGSDGALSCDAEVTDMSASGCALRARSELPVGNLVSVSVRIVGTDLNLTGKIVRAWRSDEAWSEHAGIQFDPLPASTTNLINRFLVEQLRETSNPRANCGRRTTAEA